MNSLARLPGELDPCTLFSAALPRRAPVPAHARAAGSPIISPLTSIARSGFEEPV